MGRLQRPTEGGGGGRFLVAFNFDLAIVMANLVFEGRSSSQMGVCGGVARQDEERRGLSFGYTQKK